eukprot:TRINITY_DN3937_c0_g1_i3.p1 TRINITY_DN3937_c0_g1~~TRINITY_DN3937_c0_g1_i3.p1  ORF type:complete len:239 (-),score=45.98 TRINITY_DN3937_c0_g1_i3:6-722(-)
MVMERIYSEPNKIYDHNHHVWSFVIATNMAMKIRSGEEAVRLLVRSSRISEDLNRMLEFGEEHFDCSLILREWIDEVAERPAYEFRGFASNGSLNALSMYFCMAYSEELEQRKAEIQELILNFYDSVKDKIPQSSYVIDFYVGADNTVKIIELNPFHIGAGPCLFSWRENREQFINGPFEFRITESVPDDIHETIPIRWHKYINKQLKNRKRSKRRKQLFLTLPIIIILLLVAYSLFQ